MDLVKFDEFVGAKWPKGIIRTKGLCYFYDEMEMCYIFEQAGKQVKISKAGQWYATMPKDELDRLLAAEPGLRRDWDAKYGDRMQKIVFIGQHLDKKEITKALDACLVK
jgi:G3E family GTPase